MELTVISKAKYDALLVQIQNLQFEIGNINSQVALANSNLRAMQETNNQLADIAFDENKFTQALMDKVADVARVAAREEIDVDDIASDVVERLDISEDVRRHVEHLDLVSEDKVNDLIQDYINDNDYQTESEVEDLISDYMKDNDYVERSDVIDIVQEEVNEVIDERTENVARRIAKEVMEQTETRIINSILYIIANKLLGKEVHHANNDRDTSIQVSGTNGQGEARSYNAASA